MPDGSLRGVPIDVTVLANERYFANGLSFVQPTYDAPEFRNCRAPYRCDAEYLQMLEDRPPNTYLLYGQFNNHLTWGAVNLRVQHMQLRTIVIYDHEVGVIEQEILSPTRQPVPMAAIESATFEDIPARESGIVNMTHDGQTYQVRMDGAAEPGDGTVPYNSANPWKAPSAPWIPQNWKSPYRSSDTPAGIKYIFEFKNNDFDHADSYKGQVSIDTTYYCIMSVIKNKLT